ncbi:MAG: DNA-binding response regulator, partial [Gammaproteobacteria bacterium]|nr:DNA-binding response regulator [Gammaproteobacteria bacterium]
TKPFDLNELTARLRAVVRRATGGRGNPIIEYGDITIDPAAHLVTFKGEVVHLSRREFDLLHMLLMTPGKVVSRNQMIESLYGWNDEIDSNALEVHVHNLRKKFGSDFIRTIRGVGYMTQRIPD